jgi:hypothetical protein
MKHTLAEPRVLPHFGVSRLLRGLFVRQAMKPEHKVADSIFSLACQRCAGFTTRPPANKEKDY